jgi:hypothetical protein
MSKPLDKKAVGGDLLIPAAAFGFTIYYFWTIWDAPWTAQVNAFLVGTILLILVVIFVTKTVLAVRHGTASLRIDNLLAPRELLLTRLGLLITTLGYVILIQWAGFTLTTCVFLLTAMLVLSRGRNAGLIAVLSAALALLGYLLFIVMFDTRFPRGLFEKSMQSLFGNGL